MPAITSYTEASLTAREFIRLAHGDACVYAANYGVVADYTTDDTAALQAAVDAAFGPYSAPLARENYRTLVLPPGRIRITSPIALSRGLNGGMIVGQGRFATQIHQTTAGASALVTNGCQYSYIGNFYVVTNGGVCLDLDYDGSGTNGCALQSNTFENIFFDAGDRSQATAIGIRIGLGTYMGSENIIINCFWIRCKFGINTLNFNALQNTIIGGNMQSCQWGVYAGAGSVTLIDSVGFQDQSQYDIETGASAYDSMVINACRTESTNFLKPGPQGAVVNACTYNPASTPGYFLYDTTGIIKLTGNQVNLGRLYMSRGGSIESCSFTATDFADYNGAARVVTLTNVSVGATTTARGWSVGNYVYNTDIPNGTVKWNYNDTEAESTVYGDDLCVVKPSGAGQSCTRATTSKSSGKWYWEVYIHRLTTSAEGPGVANATFTLSSVLGNDTNGISYRPGGLYYNNSNVVVMGSYTTNDYLSFALDKDNGKLWVRKNGGNWNDSGSDNPATNTGGYTIAVTGALFPTAWLGQTGSAQAAIFQSRRWKYTAPSGFAELT